MSERGYFSQRNLLPGAIFLIFLIIYFLPWLMPLISSENSGVAGLVIALIGSPAIGYLISQLWWWNFQRQGKFSSWESAKFMLQTFRILTTDPEKIEMIYDYILHSGIHSNQKQKGLSSYAFRRYDNHVLLETTKWALGAAGASGASSAFVLLIKTNGIASNIFYQDWLWIIIFTSIIIGIFIKIVDTGAQSMRKEYDEIHKTIIIGSHTAEMVAQLKKVFPEEYQISEWIDLTGNKMMYG